VRSGDGLEANADVAIAHRRRIQNGERVTVSDGIGGDLREDVGLGGRSLVFEDLPFRGRAVIGHRDGPAWGRFADGLAVKSDNRPAGSKKVQRENQKQRLHSPVPW
jgi:hypothetical protein